MRKSSNSAGLMVLLLAIGVGFSLMPVSSMAQETEAVEVKTEDTVSVELAFGTEIDPETRQLIGEAVAFPADIDRVFCYTRIHGVTTETVLTHAWYYNGKTMARVELPVRSANWRTWSSKRVLPGWVGYWEVKVLDGDGKVLASAGFDLQ